MTNLEEFYFTAEDISSLIIKEGVGPDGDKKVGDIHECVEFVSRFENSDKVGGARCIESQIINKGI